MVDLLQGGGVMGGTGDLLATRPPEMDLRAIAGLIFEHYGLTGGLTPLTSERDLNLALESPRGRFVVKIANRAEARGVTESQTAALLHLEGKGLPVPVVRRTVAGALGVETTAGWMRVLTYLEGRPLYQAATSVAQRRAMGAMAAGLSIGLQGFDHPAADHVLQWDIRQAAGLWGMMPSVPEALRPLCSAVLARFDAEIAPRLSACRWQVVHNDLNPHNVLVALDDPDRIAGVLDFGDMVRTAMVCDLAVAASYQVQPEAPLESLVDFVGAYHRVLPLQAQEWPLVADLTMVRMVTTVAITSWRAARYPENANYILRNFPAAKAGLLALLALPRDEVRQVLQRVCEGE
jgi:hydroxylysine kinase